MKRKTLLLPLVLICVLAIFFMKTRDGILVVNKHTITTHNNITGEIDNEFRNYSMSDPYVILNPYNDSPLTALIGFKTEGNDEITVTIKGKDQYSNIVNTFEPGQYHLLPIYGLYADYNNEVIIEAGAVSKTVYIETEALPEDFILPEVDTTYDYMMDSMMFVSPAAGGYVSAFDLNGDVRWYLTKNYTFDIKMLESGHLLMGSDRIIANPYYMTGIVEIDLLGKMYNEVRVPGGYHHDVFIMENGNYLIGSNNFDVEFSFDRTHEDFVVEYDPIKDEVVKTWNLKEILPITEGKMEAWTSKDWFHNNSIWYDESENSLILSGRHQDIVISIDYDTSELNWIIGDPSGFNQELVDKYFFSPIGVDFEWQYAQHSAKVLPNGNIFIFDNGNNRSKDSDTYIPAKNNYSRGVMYNVDSENMTIEQVYQFGKELGSDFYSSYISNVEFYSDNNYMIHSGGIGYLNGEVVNVPPLLIKEEGITFNSRTIELLNGEVAYEMNLPTNIYRAKKFKLYNTSSNHDLSEGSIKGQTYKNTEYEFDVDTKLFKENEVPTKYNLEFLLEEDRLVVNGLFNQGQKVYLKLSGDEKRMYHIPTKIEDYTAMCIYVTSDNELNIFYYLNTDYLTGKYDLSIVIDGIEYKINKDLIT